MKIKEPEKILKKLYKKTTTGDWLAVIVVFIVGIINNFTFFITEGIAPDALSPADFNIAGNWEITLGRFGIKYINNIRFGLVNKFLIVLISLAFIAISIVILIRIFQIKNKIIIFLISTIIAIAPQFTETYFFIYCADAYCFAFLMATLAVYFLKKTDTKKYYYIATIISTIIVCSMYQAYLGVEIGIAIIVLIQNLIKNKDAKLTLINAFKYFVTIFMGVVLYYIILKIILYVLGLSLASYKGANKLGIETIKALPKTILQTYKDFYNFFFTNKIINNSYYKRTIIYAILYVATFLGFINIIKKSKYNQKILRFTLMLILMLLFPIGINIMNLIAPDTTINLVTGPGIIITILFIAIIYNELSDTSIENLFKYIYIITLLILSLTFILENTFTYMCRHETYRNYYTVANDIYSKVTELDEYSKDKKWLFSDVIRFKARDTNRSNGFISSDNETWNNYGGIAQNYNFFDKYLGIKIKMCSNEEYKNLTETEEFKNMPIYPNKGSIKIINDIIVIKISENTFN